MMMLLTVSFFWHQNLKKYLLQEKIPFKQCSTQNINGKSCKSLMKLEVQLVTSVIKSINESLKVVHKLAEAITRNAVVYLYNIIISCFLSLNSISRA